MKRRTSLLRGVGSGIALSVLAGCAAWQQRDSRPAYCAGDGRLIVNNASRAVISKAGTMVYPHGSYTLYNEHRIRIKRVTNQSGRNGEAAETVTLPAGRYYVVTESETGQAITVPAVMTAGRDTVVNLEPPQRSIAMAPRLSP